MTDSASKSLNELELDEPIPPMFGQNLRIDEEDEQNLEELPEIERELILEERFRIWQKYKEEKALYDKYTKKHAPVVEKAAVNKRKAPSAVSVSERKANKKPVYKESVSSGSSSSSDSSSSYSSSESSSESADEEKRLMSSRQAVMSTEQDIARSMDLRMTIDVAKSIQVSRDILSTSFSKVPSHVRDTALVDLLVRVPNGVGGYVVGRVVQVTEDSSSGSEGCKFQLLTDIPNPSSASTVVPVLSVSNSPILETEVEEWINRVGDESSTSLARKSGLKISQIKSVVGFVWNDSAINQVLEEKRKTNKAITVKLTLEIAKLRTSLQAELSMLNGSNVTPDQRSETQIRINEINQKIADLERQYREAQRAFQEANAHQYGIVAINFRNKKEQRKQELEEARMRLKEKSNVVGEPKSDALNPFKRRECKPVVMWDVGNKSPRKEIKTAEVANSPQENANTTHTAADTTTSDSSIADLVDLKQLANSLGDVDARSRRMAEFGKCMCQQYSKKVSPLWEKQLAGMKGNVIEFAEWKRQVAAMEDDEIES